LEGRRHSQLAKIALARLLDGHRDIDAIANLYVRAKGARNLLFNGMEHGKLDCTVARALMPAVPARLPALML